MTEDNLKKDYVLMVDGPLKGQFVLAPYPWELVLSPEDHLHHLALKAKGYQTFLPPSEITLYSGRRFVATSPRSKNRTHTIKIYGTYANPEVADAEISVIVTNLLRKAYPGITDRKMKELLYATCWVGMASLAPLNKVLSKIAWRICVCRESRPDSEQHSEYPTFRYVVLYKKP